MTFKPSCVSWVKYSFSITSPLQEPIVFWFWPWGGGGFVHKLNISYPFREYKYHRSSMVFGKDLLLYMNISFLRWPDRPNSRHFSSEWNTWSLRLLQKGIWANFHASSLYSLNMTISLPNFNCIANMQEKAKSIHWWIIYLLISMNQVSHS